MTYATTNYECNKCRKKILRISSINADGLCDSALRSLNLVTAA